MVKEVSNTEMIRCKPLTGTSRLQFKANNLKIITKLVFLNEAEEVIKSWSINKEINLMTQLIAYKSAFFEPILDFNEEAEVLTISWLIKENSNPDISSLSNYLCDCSCIRKTDKGLINCYVTLIDVGKFINVIVEVL